MLATLRKYKDIISLFLFFSGGLAWIDSNYARAKETRFKIKEMKCEFDLRQDVTSLDILIEISIRNKREIEQKHIVLTTALESITNADEKRNLTLEVQKLESETRLEDAKLLSYQEKRFDAADLLLKKACQKPEEAQ